MKQSAREDLQTGEAVRETATVPFPARGSPPGGPGLLITSNAAVQRLVTGASPDGGFAALSSGGLGGLPAGGGRALGRLYAGSGAVQAKFSLSRPGDPLERQADAMAARVTAGPANESQQAAAPPPASPGTSGPSVPPATEALITNPGSGSPLAPEVRERIEAHLGVSLADVQVHTGPDAQLAAAQLQARAFTTGSHIFLGSGESPGDLALMAHEATHVVQQQAVNVYRQTVLRSVSDYIPDFIMDAVRSYARAIPGYRLLTVIAEYDPIADRAVQQTPENLVAGLLDLVPFGNEIAGRLGEMRVLQDAFRVIDRGLTEHGLTTARLSREIEQAENEVSLEHGIDGNIAIISRHIDAVYQDVLAFARSIVDMVVKMIRDAAAEFAEKYLVGTPVWELAKKVLHYDPLRGIPVEAATVDILADFLRLIGKEGALAQMRERGSLQKTADWLDTQITRFGSLVGELRALFQAGWDAIQPANLANLPANLQALAHSAVGLVQRVADFATDVIGQVLKLVKESLLGWLSSHAHEMPGFRLLTVIIGKNPFTDQVVPRTAENLIGGFIALLPGGEATYAKLAESGVIAEAAGQIEGAIGRLGISLELIANTFLGIWNSLSLEDLLAPIAAFDRVLARFGEFLARIVAFVGEVIKIVITLILKLMNFPSDLLGSIISNAMQAIDDIERDPVGFLVHMLEALKTGLTGFFDHVLTYLLQGLGSWLLRGLGQLGIAMPTDLSFQSILNLVLGVLGVTVETLWQKLAKQIGEENMARMRGAIDTLTGAWKFIRDIQERGVAALWEFVSDKLGNLWDTLLSMAKDWIVTEIIEAVTAKLISMLDPTGVMAIVNSFIAFFRAIESAIEYLRDILRIVNEWVTTFAAVAAGNIGAGAAKLEQGLAHAIPVAIGFLASQAGIGNVPEKIVEIIQGLRQMIDEALEWLFQQAMRMGAAALGAPGIGKAGQPPQDPAPEATPAAAAAGQIPAGLPPEQTKRLTLEMVLTGLSGGKAGSIAAVHQQLAAVMVANKDRGLHGLRATVPDPTSLEVLIEAFASPPQGRRIAWSSIFTPSQVDADEEIEALRRALSKASQATYAAIVVDGVQVGTVSSSGENQHAEERLVRGPSWKAAVAAAQRGVASAGSSRVTLLINRSPCMHCVQWLKDAIQEARTTLGGSASSVVFLLAATGTYRKQARMSDADKKALHDGAQRMALRTGRPFDEVFRVQEQFWKEDLRSESTEWQDDADGKVYSGLSELAAAGWQLAGLDAGQPVTPRQLEFAAIAAKLSNDLAWSSG